MKPHHEILTIALGEMVSALESVKRKYENKMHEGHEITGCIMLKRLQYITLRTT